MYLPPKSEHPEQDYARVSELLKWIKMINNSLNKLLLKSQKIIHVIYRLSAANLSSQYLATRQSQIKCHNEWCRNIAALFLTWRLAGYCIVLTPFCNILLMGCIIGHRFLFIFWLLKTLLLQLISFFGCRKSVCLWIAMHNIIHNILNKINESMHESNSLRIPAISDIINLHYFVLYHCMWAETNYTEWWDCSQ